MWISTKYGLIHKSTALIVYSSFFLKDYNIINKHVQNVREENYLKS